MKALSISLSSALDTVATYAPGCPAAVAREANLGGTFGEAWNVAVRVLFTGRRAEGNVATAIGVPRC